MSRKNNIKNIYTLSPMQEGMLFHAVMDEQSTAYVEQTVIVLRGAVDPVVFEETFQRLVDRYDILRTVFVHKTTRRPRQVVLKEQRVDFHFQDLSHMDGESGKARVETLCLQDRQKGFDLTKGPLMRVFLYKVSTSTWYLVWTFHHILMDGWCLTILLKDFMRLYYARLDGKSITLEPVIPYNRYIQWLEKQDKQKGLDYWKSYLEDCQPPAGLPKLRHHREHNRYRGGEFKFMLDETPATRLQQVARDNRVTQSTIMQTLWGILLQRYNDTRDVVFGVVVSGRPAEIQGADAMVGLFINTVPVRIKTEPGESFSHLLKKVQFHTLRSTSYEYLPLADIQAFSTLQNQPLDHIFVFENYPISGGVPGSGKQEKTSTGLAVEKAEMHEQTNYDLNLVISPGKRPGIKFIFNCSVYDEELLGRAARQLNEIARQALDNPGIEVNAVDILSDEEKKQVLFDFNETAADFPGEKTLHELFEEQAEKRPDGAAVIGHGCMDAGMQGNISITYGELKRKSDQVACMLRERGVLADDIVAIMVERSIEMIIGIFGILKAGGAYLPIDPDYPRERIDFTLKDSNASILLATENTGGLTLKTISVSSVAKNSSSNLAYIIYTSGTTGQAKGVMTTHRNAVRVVKRTNYIEITPEDRVMQISNYAFDGSIFDIFGALLNGAVLVMMGGEGISALDRLSAQLRRDRATVFFVTTALFNALVDLDIGCLQDIRKVLYGGERISVPHARKALDYLGPGRVVHVYGPTETTVYASYYPIDTIDDSRVTIPIGKPVANTTAYILSKNLDPVPMGAAGELYIGGQGTARGYLNQPELTAEQFITAPASSSSSSSSWGLRLAACGCRFYKTGDLVRMLPDGNIEFIGRVDRQVKIRGFRVEPGEIEHHLLKHKKVKEVYVAVGDGDDRYLCAYIVPGPAPAEVPELREYLAGELPDYLVPGYFVMMDKLPLNPNGKVDTGALPKPRIGTGGDVFTAPRDPVETKMAKVWSEILSIPAGSIGIDSDFFGLGGHSLRAMSMVSKLHRELGVKIPLREVFTSPTIRELAANAANRDALKSEPGQSTYRAVEPAEEREYYPVSSAQKRLYIFQQMAAESTGYNIPTPLVLEGEIEKNKFEGVFTQLITRHESLRTSFQAAKGEPVQKIRDASGVFFKIEYFSVQPRGGSPGPPLDPAAVIHRFVRPFDLSRAPLMRVGLVKQENHRYLLVLDIHHIITDGVSMALFFKEFLALYLGKTLPPLRLQFKDYSQWYNRGVAGVGEEYRREESFWLKHLEGPPPAINLPTDFARPPLQSFEGRSVDFEIGAEETKKLKELASGADATLFMVLQAICVVWLSKLSGQEDIVLGIPIEGRPHPDLHHIIGMFVNTLAIRNQPRRNKTFREFLNEVKKRTLLAFENQDYQFEDLVNALAFTPDPGRNPVFDVMFILQNLEADAAYIPGIEKEATAEKTGLRMKTYPYKNPVAKFDMILTAVEAPTGKAVGMMLEYSTRLFKRETIEQFVGYYMEILRAVTGDKNIRLEDIRVSHGLKQVETQNPEMDLGF